MQALPSREQMGAYVRQATIELLEGAAPAAYDPRQPAWQRSAAEGASCKQDSRHFVNRADIYRLLD